MTLPEVLIAVGVSALVLAALLFTILSVAREGKRSFTDSILLQQADQCEDKIMGILRTMSKSEGVTYGDGNSAGVFSRIVVAQGPVPDYPRQQIYFDSASQTLRYSSNLGVSTTGTPLVTLRNHIALDSVAFYPSIKPDGSLDSSLVNVLLQLDDGGYSGRRAPDGTAKTNLCVRTFTIALRNP